MKNCNALLWPPGYDDSVSTMSDGVGGGGPPSFVQSGVQQFLYSGQTPYTRRIGSQSYVADKSSSGDYRNAPQLGRCYLFDGTDDYVDIPNHADFNVTSAFTWAGWYYINTAAHYDRFADQSYSDSWAITQGGSQNVEFWINNNYRAFSNGFTWSLSTWFHLACTFDQVDAKIYINGSQKASSGYTTAIGNSNNSIKIGRADTAAAYLDGAAFDCRMYAQALTAAEISYLYSFGASGSDPGLTNLRGWWKCDDTHASTAYDSSGNGHHGTKTNITTSTFHSTSATLPYSYQNRVGYTDDVTNGLVPRDESDTANDVTGSTLEYTGRTHYDGELGGLPGMTFNGTSEYLSKGSRLTSGALSELTVAFWFMRTGTQVYSAQVAEDDPTAGLSSRVFNIGMTDGYVACYFFGGGGYKERWNTSGSVYNDGVWHHVAWIFNGGTITCYVDGASIALTTGANGAFSALHDAPRSFSVGAGMAAPPTHYHRGSLCDVRVFASALSAGDIATIYAGGKVTTGLIEQWPMCEGSGSTIYGTEGNTLTLTSASPATVHSTKNTVNDHLIRYGGRLDSGVYIPGDLDGLLAANGSALTFGPGVLPDDGSFINRKPAAYPLLNDVETSHGSLNTSEEVGDATTDPNSATDTGTTRHSFQTPDP